MSIAEHITHLERLAAIDAEIKLLTEGIGKETGELADVRAEMADLDERVKADTESVAEMDKTRNDLLQEVRQIASQIDRSRERLQRARNEREVNAAEREIDELRKIQRDRDDEIKKLTELADSARVSISEGAERHKALSSRLEGSLEGATESITGLQGKLDLRTKEREEVSVKLPNIVRRRYQRLHERGKVPVAKTHDGTCLGCFVKLPPMMFHTMLSQTEFEECPTCHRIIFYQPKPSEEEQAVEAQAVDEQAVDGQAVDGQGEDATEATS